MEPIRILNLFTIMNRGGAETMVMNYYRHIDRTKVQFDFMVHRSEKGAYDDEIVALGGKIYHMPEIRPWTSFNYRKQVSKFYCDHPEYRIIHSHMSELGYYDFIEAQKANVPVRICHAHNSPHGFDIKSPVRWYYKTMMKPYITHRFMCGEESGNWLFGKKYKDSFIRLNNAIDAQAYAFNPDIRIRIRDSLGISASIVVGHVGRFNYQKNHPFIIDVFSELLKKNGDAVLLLVGNDSGDDGAAIHDKVKTLGIEKQVQFLGTRTDVADVMQAMDVFLFPSFFEGLSLASIEAQASGLPLLISDRIPIECKKTDLVHVYPLSMPASQWADEIIKLSKTERRNTTEEIRQSGYDIQSNAKVLQDFYLKAWEAAN